MRPNSRSMNTLGEQFRLNREKYFVLKVNLKTLIQIDEIVSTRTKYTEEVR